MKLSKIKNAGFTLIEIIAVLLILVIAAAIAIAKAPSLTSYQVIPEAEIIKGHLRYAQERAVDTSTVWYITFQAGSYTLNNANGTNPFLPGTNSNTANLPAGMTITAGTVAFDTWGTPYTDTGATQPQSSGGYRSFNLTLGTTTSVIQVADNTGYIP